MEQELNVRREKRGHEVRSPRLPVSVYYMEKPQSNGESNE